MYLNHWIGRLMRMRKKENKGVKRIKGSKRIKQRIKENKGVASTRAVAQITMECRNE